MDIQVQGLSGSGRWSMAEAAVSEWDCIIAKSWSQGTAGGRRLLPASVLAAGMVTRPTSMLHCIAPTMQSCGPSCVSNWSVRLMGKRKYGVGRNWMPSSQHQYQALLSDYFWGVNAVVVNEFVQEYLFSLWDARQLVIRGQTASNGAGLHGREATSIPHNNVCMYVCGYLHRHMPQVPDSGTYL
jgi:hypothetical protein